MLADLHLVGFLNTGFRNPRAFGLAPSKDQSYTIEYIFFKACRITFEHLLILQKIPNNFVQGIDVGTLNAFIEQNSV